MTGWFDKLSIAAASQPDTQRRNIIVAVIGGLCVNSWPGRLMAAPVETLKKKMPGVVPVHPPFAASAAQSGCIRHVNANGSVVSTDSVADGDLRMQMTLSYQFDGSATTDLIVTKANQSVLNLHASATKAGASEVRIARGVGFSGIKVETAQTQDGKSFSGTMDGRAYALAGANANAPIRFNDGGVVPRIQAQSFATTQLPALAKTLATRLATCTTQITAPTTKPVTKTLHAIQPGLVHKLAPGQKSYLPVLPFQPVNGPTGPQPGTTVDGKARSGTGWNSDGHTYPAGGTADSPACNSCYDNANADYASAFDGPIGNALGGGFLGALAGVFGAAASGGSSAAIAAAVWAKDMAACNLPGGDCYPVSCGGGWEACAKGDNCLEAGICCATASQSNLAGIQCGQSCCAPGVSACAGDGGCGCPNNTAACGDFCCPPGSVCCDGQCYTANTQCCNGIPCTNGSKCLSGSKGEICCNAETLCRGSDCCGLNTCTLDGCCVQNKVCGEHCCAADQICQNGQCVKSPCASGATYCDGQCCPPSDAHGAIGCCTPIHADVAPYANMNHGCHHVSACYNAPR